MIAVRVIVRGSSRTTERKLTIRALDMLAENYYEAERLVCAAYPGHAVKAQPVPGPMTEFQLAVMRSTRTEFGA